MGVSQTNLDLSDFLQWKVADESFATERRGLADSRLRSSKVQLKSAASSRVGQQPCCLDPSAQP